MTAVDSEIRVGCEKQRIVQRLGHAYQAGIGEAHRGVRVFVHQLQCSFKVLLETEAQDHHAAQKQPGDTGATMRFQQVKGFGQNRFAGIPWGRESLRLTRRPIVVGVAPAQQSDQKSRVNEDVFGRSRFS
jgi:hypothetical protein